MKTVHLSFAPTFTYCNRKRAMSPKTKYVSELSLADVTCERCKQVHRMLAEKEAKQRLENT